MSRTGAQTLSLIVTDRVIKLNLTEGNINVNDGSRNPVLIPEKKKERKTSTEIVGAEKGTWKQEITLLKGLNPTDIKEFLPKVPETSFFQGKFSNQKYQNRHFYICYLNVIYYVDESFEFVEGFEYLTTKWRSRNGPSLSMGLVESTTLNGISDPLKLTSNFSKKDRCTLGIAS